MFFRSFLFNFKLLTFDTHFVFHETLCNSNFTKMMFSEVLVVGFKFLLMHTLGRFTKEKYDDILINGGVI